MEDFIPIVAILCAVGLPIATGLVLGYNAIRNEHRERMGLIEQGIIPPNKTKKKSDPNRLVSLRNGIVLIALGIGIIVGFFCSDYLAIGQGNQFWVTGASVVFFLGVGYLIYFLVTRKMVFLPQQEDNERE